MRHRLGIIGGGNMGYAIARGAVEAGLLDPRLIIVAEVDAGRRAAAGALGCSVTERPVEVIAAEEIMLAVKPQVFPAVAADIGPVPGTVIISIMAGLGSGRIRAALGEEARVVRVMPNTPCQIGAGVAAVALGAGARPGDDALAIELFSALGRVVTVEERLMHAVTAVSGSGPAYVFLLAEAMESAAVDLGLDAETARTLVEHTVAGAGRLLLEHEIGNSTTGSSASHL